MLKRAGCLLKYRRRWNERVNTHILNYNNAYNFKLCFLPLNCTGPHQDVRVAQVQPWWCSLKRTCENVHPDVANNRFFIFGSASGALVSMREKPGFEAHLRRVLVLFVCVATPVLQYSQYFVLRFLLSLLGQNMGVGSFYCFRDMHDPPRVHDRATYYGVLWPTFLFCWVYYVFTRRNKGVLARLYTFGFSDTTDSPHRQKT